MMWFFFIYFDYLVSAAIFCWGMFLRCDLIQAHGHVVEGQSGAEFVKGELTVEREAVRGSSMICLAAVQRTGHDKRLQNNFDTWRFVACAAWGRLLIQTIIFLILDCCFFSSCCTHQLHASFEICSFSLGSAASETYQNETASLVALVVLEICVGFVIHSI